MGLESCRASKINVYHTENEAADYYLQFRLFQFNKAKVADIHEATFLNFFTFDSKCALQLFL